MQHDTDDLDGTIELCRAGFAYEKYDEAEIAPSQPTLLARGTSRGDFDELKTTSNMYVRHLNRAMSTLADTRAAARSDTKGAWIFTQMSIKINAGESVAFVGPSGCGKSTIAKLVLRFADVSEGILRVGGR